MVRIRRFGIVSTANTIAAIYAVVVLIFVVFFSLIALLGIAVIPRDSNAAAGAAGLGVIGILIGGVLFTIVYAVFGWIFTAIACALYNVVAGRVGGIAIQVESTTPQGPGGGYPAYGYPGYPAPGGVPGAAAVPGPDPVPGARPAGRPAAAHALGGEGPASSGPT